LFLALVPALPAAAAKPVIATYTAMSGVPSHVARGGTLAFSLTFTQQSAYRINLDGLSFEVWNRCLCNPDNTEGKVATYLDPTTGTWRSSPPASGDAFLLELSTHLAVSPGQKVTIPVRLKMTGFRDGSYTVADNGTIVGNALDPNGNFIEFTWQYHEAADKHFTVGTATAPAPKTSSAPKPRATRSSAPAPKASASPSPPVSPSPSASPSDSPSASPSPVVAAPVAQAAPSGHGWWVPVSISAVALLSFLLYAMSRRRRTPSTPDAV
jgi:hypothetical protein